MTIAWFNKFLLISKKELVNGLNLLWYYNLTFFRTMFFFCYWFLALSLLRRSLFLFPNECRPFFSLHPSCSNTPAKFNLETSICVFLLVPPSVSLSGVMSANRIGERKRLTFNITARVCSSHLHKFTTNLIDDFSCPGICNTTTADLNPIWIFPNAQSQIGKMTTNSCALWNTRKIKRHDM